MIHRVVTIESNFRSQRMRRGVGKVGSCSGEEWGHENRSPGASYAEIHSPMLGRLEISTAAAKKLRAMPGEEKFEREEEIQQKIPSTGKDNGAFDMD